ncbi:PEP-utilizing enzyme [Azospirillum sp. TSA6c]|uniref:PEP-utilizing enzyme n=1 Tax=Azospirillum sp. TSA6c TaxID=709813 RepID=UPI001304AD63|nr:PEP-utilizing enzyme [Azospirillum sp. TSA6c]
MMTNEQYRILVKLDPIALKALRISLYGISGRIISDRIEKDYIDDTGIIPLLQQRYSVSGSIEDIANIYWSSRVFYGAPRYESLAATLIKEVALAVVVDIIKENLPAAQTILPLLSPDLAVAAVCSIPVDLQRCWEDARILLTCVNLKCAGRDDEVKRITEEVIDGLPFKVDNDSREFVEAERQLKAIKISVKSVIEEEYRLAASRPVAVQEGRSESGYLCCAPGVGFGKTIHWAEALDAISSKKDIRNRVILVDRAFDSHKQLRSAIQSVSAVVGDSIGMTSHTSVISRQYMRPCLGQIKDLGMLSEKYCLVDAMYGRIKMFEYEPSDPYYRQVVAYQKARLFRSGD